MANIIKVPRVNNSVPWSLSFMGFNNNPYSILPKHLAPGILKPKRKYITSDTVSIAAWDNLFCFPLPFDSPQ